MLRIVFAASLLALGVIPPAAAGSGQALNHAVVFKSPPLQNAETEIQDCFDETDSRSPEALQFYTAAEARNSDGGGQKEPRPTLSHDCALV